MTALANPGKVTITTAYTAAGEFGTEVSTNGYAKNTLPHALGSANPAAPAFDGIEIVGAFESQDVDGNFWYVVVMPGAVDQDFFDNVSFQIGSTALVLYTEDSEYAQDLITNFTTWRWSVSASLFGTNPVTYQLTIEDLTDDFNCDCTSWLSTGGQFNQETLGALRRRMMIKLGYAAQASNPPPGMKDFCNEYLQDAQIQLLKKFKAKNISRFFRWVMVPGQRYYAMNGQAGGCDLTFDPDRVSWVGFEDLNRAWYNLIEGIPPEFYTRANINFGWPARYEMRGCIEIFPAPQAAYTLWVKADMTAQPFVDLNASDGGDSNYTTIDSELVLLLATGNAKAARGQQDAQQVISQATTYLGALVAGSHRTARYIPRTRAQNPATPPRFLPLGPDQQA